MSKLHPDRVELGSLTTTQRDALSVSPAGTVVYNSTLGIVQHWDGSAWIGMSNVFGATGGTVSTSSRPGYKLTHSQVLNFYSNWFSRKCRSTDYWRWRWRWIW